MQNSISLSKYHYNDTLIHKMHPTSKIITSLIYILLVLIQNNLYITLSLTLLLVLMLYLSKINIKIILKTLNSTKYLMIFLLIINIINGFSLEIYTIYVLKLLLVMVEANILITTTNLNDLNYGIYVLFLPLEKLFKISAKKLAFSITLSLRFIPTLLNKGNKIIKAQTSRGVNFKTNNIKNKIYYLSSILIPLIINTIKEADEVADTMELRMYDVDNFTIKPKKNNWDFMDYYFLTTHITLLVMIMIRGVIL